MSLLSAVAECQKRRLRDCANATWPFRPRNRSPGWLKYCAGVAALLLLRFLPLRLIFDKPPSLTFSNRGFARGERQKSKVGSCLSPRLSIYLLNNTLDLPSGDQQRLKLLYHKNFIWQHFLKQVASLSAIQNNQARNV
jgi:hypothetical protein